MSDIVVVHGSRKKDGNTGTLIKNMADCIKSRGFETEVLFLQEYNIRFIGQCGICYQEGKCMASDDSFQLLEKCFGAKAIVFSTPIYYYSPSGQMKTFMDRFFCKHEEAAKRLENKIAAVILAAEFGEDHCQETISMFRRFLEFYKMRFVGYIAVKATRGDVVSNHAALQSARDLGTTIVNQILDSDSVRS